MLKRPKLPSGFQGGVFKGNIRGVGHKVLDQLFCLLVGGELRQ